MTAGKSQPFKRAADGYPFPIAAACRAYLDRPSDNRWQEWERLSRDVLTPVLHYLSHLLLSDLISTGRKPAHLFHRIQSILSRPLGGHYVGFLRETARYYREEELDSGIPELVDFVLRSDVDCTVLDDGKALLGLLVEYRNLWAHGRFDNPEALKETVEAIQELTVRLLEEIQFLERYPLQLEDGTVLMGSDASSLPKEPQPLVVISAGEVVLRPLLVKLKGQDLVLLEDFDLSGGLAYRGATSHAKFTKKQTKKGDGAQLYEELKALLERVRAIDAVLERPDWETFSERSSVVTDRVISLYEEMRKYLPAWYVPRPEWHGEGSLFERFMASDKSLLALSGVQGTGKSALVSHLSQEAREAGHAVLFINAQRFTFADVEWTGNPYPGYFADLLHYSRPFEKEVFKRLLNTVPEGKKVVLFIDAINEVDGIQAKWNRFRAMELLLEWIAEISQPRLKVILSFRLDAYEEFEYLQPDEVPPELGDISFTVPGHQNPRKPWVMDLEPFDEAQAKLLYDKLQAEPQHGMAPAMAWREILAGLGDNVEEFTSNPLLFMIFLRSHHQEHVVHTNDREELFQRYADKLTGADEVKRWPLWKKVIGFVKNGNITPKEQFLADMVSKMTEGGSAAFLVEDLNPSRGRKSSKKRDRRLLKILADPSSRELSDLKDGGVVTEEKITVRSGETEHTSRRLGFVAELLATMLDSVLERVGSIAHFRFGIGMVAFGFIVIVGAGLLITVGIRSAFETMGVVSGGPLERAIPVLDYGIRSLWFLISFSLAVSCIAPLVKLPFPMIYARQVGLIQKFTFDTKVRELSSQIALVSALCVPPWLLLPLLLFAEVFPWDHQGSVVLTFAVGGLIGFVIVIAACCLPGVQLHFLRLLGERYLSLPARVRVSSSRAASQVSSNLNQWVPKGRSAARVVAMMIMMIAIGLILQHAWPEPPEIANALTLIDYSMNLSLVDLEIGFEKIGRNATVGFSVAAFIMGLVSFVWHPFLLRAVRRVDERLSTEPLPRPPNRAFWLAVGSVQFGALVGGLLAVGIVNVLISISASNDMNVLEAAGVPAEAITRDRLGRVTALNLAEPDSNLEGGFFQAGFAKLTQLRLPAEAPSVDVSNLKSLDRLTASPKSIDGLDDAVVTKLELLPPCTDITQLSSKTLTHLLLHDGCVLSGDIAERFPNLLKLMGHETSLRGLEISGKAKSNLMVTVEGSLAPVLDWVNSTVGDNAILSLEHPPDTRTENLNLVRRLLLRNPAELDPRLLESATSAEWILIAIDESLPSEWYLEFRNVVANALSNLKTIEFSEETKTLRSLRSAKSREEALVLLDELAANPETLGASPLNKEL